MNELETHIISEFQRNEEEKVRLGLKAYKGKIYFDLRIWFPDKETRELIPSKKGICLNLDYLPQMKSFVDTLESAKTCLPEGFAAGDSMPAEKSDPNRSSEGVEAKHQAASAPRPVKKSQGDSSGSRKPFTRHF